MATKLEEELKDLVIILYKRKYTQTKIAKLIGISQSSVSSTIKAYKPWANLLLELGEEIEDTIISLYKDNKDINYIRSKLGWSGTTLITLFLKDRMIITPYFSKSKYKEIVANLYNDGFAQKDIADIFGISQSSVSLLLKDNTKPEEK